MPWSAGPDTEPLETDVGAGLAPPSVRLKAQLRGQDAHATAGETPALRIVEVDLVEGTGGGEAIFHKPVVYQPSTNHEPKTKNEEL